MGCLYKLTSPSGKSYIGITSKTLEKRWAKHVEHALGKRDAGALYAALRKYGADEFTRITLAFEDDWDKLCLLERQAIKEHGTLSPGGYNLTEGGEGTLGPISDRARVNVAAAQKLRFSRPDQRANLMKIAARARASTKAKRALLPADYVPAWIMRRRNRTRMSSEEHSLRTRMGMSRPEVHAKVIACARRRAADPKWRSKISASKRGKTLPPCSEQHKRRISEARKREWADPVMRAKRLKAFHK